ncbi:MAG TPA: SRPBCC family protein [Bordetella sp.]|jgi:carbon monoxide dehydrogenase subunit G|nr:SRPBCC family protein [Bordetella sp.]
MEFTNTFHVPLPLEEAWQLMLDVPRILPCLPGARLTEVLGDNRYKGSVSVRLGPIRLSFDGQAELVRRDDTSHVAWLEGSGIDPKGRGSARSEFSFALAPAADGGTRVTVTTQLALSGSVAQYGRGSGMIAEVASQILGQFERNLAQSLAPGGEGMADAAPPAMQGERHPSAPHSAAAPNAFRADGPGTASGACTAVSSATPAQAVDVQVVLLQAQAILSQAQAVLVLAQSRMVQGRHGAARGAAPAGELNMLSIGLKAMWARFRYGLGGLFGRRP